MDKELTIIAEPEELIAWADTFDILLNPSIEDAEILLKGYIFYEAKFRKEPVTESIVQNEIRQVKQTDLDCYRYGFFSRAGFTCDQEKECILIDLSELYK